MTANKTPKLLIHKNLHYRRQKLIQDVQRWCKSFGISYQTWSPDDPTAPDWKTIGAVYFPLEGELKYLKDIPPDIPLIFDFDGASGGILRSAEYLEGRRFAFRRAFGLNCRYTPELQVPYCHYPLQTTSTDKRDVIILDTHRWLPLKWQFRFISILCQMVEDLPLLDKLAGKRVSFYVTSFVPLEPYAASAQKWMDDMRALTKGFDVKEGFDVKTHNIIRLIIDRLIPPLENTDDYHQLFHRARLFITDHADLADQDVVHAGCAGVPIYILTRNPWHPPLGIVHSLADACGILVRDFSKALDTFNDLLVQNSRNPENIYNHNPIAWDHKVFEELYANSWKTLWDWAIHGINNEEVTNAILSAPTWKV